MAATLSFSPGKHHMGMLDTGVLSTLRFDTRNNQTSPSRRVWFKKSIQRNIPCSRLSSQDTWKKGFKQLAI